MEKQSTDDSKNPHIAVNAQYIKDFSFENPGAPGSLANMTSTPQIDLALDLNIQKMPEDDYFEVEIAISAKAMNEASTLFIVDLKYAGIFNLINIPEEQMEMLLAVHCPSIIFPYARKIIADVTQDGGFQPLMIDPVDFGILYGKKMMEKSGHDKKNEN
jgi:preprotein translocase subunit SecB